MHGSALAGAPIGMRRPVLAIAAVIASGGFLTPSIPIPPPDPGRMTFAVTGDGANTSATFQYPPDVNYGSSIVYVFNRDRGVGIIETARVDGSVGPTRPVPAALGEQIVVTFQVED